MDEVWKDITILNNIFNGRYQVSNFGKICSLPFTYTIKEWKSGRLCCREIGVSQSHLNDCCNHKAKTHKGFVFMFKTEWEGLQPKTL